MIVTQTPLRISFAGGGTDLPSYYTSGGGAVVSAALDKSVFVIVTARHDSAIYVNYSKKEIVESVDQIQHELVREAMAVTGVREGVEITLLSDIPSEGSGLGSSSSFTVGLLNALHAYRGEQVSARRLAEEACLIEIERCGRPIGKQDQYIAAYGGVHAFEFHPNGCVKAEPLRLGAREIQRLQNSLHLFYSNRTRQAASILEEQNSRAHENRADLDDIKGLAQAARKAIVDGDLPALGAVLDENWKLKKRLSARISNDVIDQMYRTCKDASAYGAKLCGAGGGGFLLVCGAPETHGALRDAMAAYRCLPVHIDTAGSRVIFHYRRTAWS